MAICPVRYALNILEGKWKLIILYTISVNGTIRFNELQRQINGISNLMLTKTLRELEKDGLVFRVQFNEVPPHVEYSLSNLGKGIFPVLDSLGKWGQELFEDNQENQDENTMCQV